MYQSPVLGAVPPGEKQDCLLKLIGYVPDQRKALSKPQSDVQTEEKPAPYGLCRICGSPIGIAAARRAVAQATRLRRQRETIAIPGNDASLCSSPARTCSSSGWVTNHQGLAQSSQSYQGGAAS